MSLVTVVGSGIFTTVKRLSNGGDIARLASMISLQTALEPAVPVSKLLQLARRALAFVMSMDSAVMLGGTLSVRTQWKVGATAQEAKQS